MDNQEDQVALHNLREDREQEEDVFIIALREAIQANASAQEVHGILDRAPSVVPLSKLQRMVSFAFKFNAMVDVEVLRVLLEYQPEIARSKSDRIGGFLLHEACYFGDVHLDVLQLVIDSYPDALHEKDWKGRLPLHWACNEDDASLDAIQLLLSYYPDAIRVHEAEEGKLPIHLALEESNCDNIILALLDAYPEAAMVPMNGGALALHLALYYIEDLSSSEIVHQLVESYPEALHTRDGRGMLPLHQACRRSWITVDLLKYLVKKCPDSVQAKGPYGMLPLHYAAEAGAPLDIIQYLVEVYPNAISTTTDIGTLPIHEACASYHTTREVFQLLLDRYDGPESHHRGLSVTNDDGRLPLHMYAARNGDSDLLQHFIDLYPEAVRVVDRNGRLPLHEACDAYRPDLDNIRNLVEADSFTVIQKTLNGSTPYQLAWRLVHERRQRRRQRRRHDIETYLVEKQNEVVNAMKEAFEDMADTQLGLPDLVVAKVWSFAKPDLWQP